MEQYAKKIVENIFNNWSALQLAVEHSMGGPTSRQNALEGINLVTNFISQNDYEVEDLEDLLEDMMDQEFNTICEDDSIREISILLHKFSGLLKQGLFAECEEEFKKLPVGRQWLSSQSAPAEQQNIVQENSQMNESTETPIEADPEWTQVKSKRNR